MPQNYRPSAAPDVTQAYGAPADIGAQVKIALDGIIGAAHVANARFGVAVSGGPDSMALLHILHHIAPGRVFAATIDHQLRAAAADEAAMVAQYCSDWGISHHILYPETPITGSLQAAARAVRYALLDRWRIAQDIDWILTAHHADDQLETLLMRLQRGSGSAGLAGVRARNGHIVRPMLGVRRSDIMAYCAHHGLKTAQDPSNHDPAFDRARLRIALADAADRPIAAWLDPIHASISAQHVAGDAAALDWAAAEIASTCIAPDGSGKGAGVFLTPRDCPSALWRRVVLLALQRVDPACQPRAGALDDAIAAMASGQTAMLGNSIIRMTKDATLRPRPWHITMAPLRKSG